MAAEEIPLFEDSQPWPRWLAIFAAVACAGVILFCSILAGQQIQRLQSGQPAPGALGIVVALVFVSLMEAGVIFFFLTGRLVVRVFSNRLTVQVIPLPGRTVPFEQIERVELGGINALREFGGWGVRWRPGAIGYVIGGRQAVQIWLKSGRRIVIAYDRSEELARILETALERWRRRQEW